MSFKNMQATIMVIDDDADNLNYISAILHEQEYCILTFSRGDEALKSAEQRPPDLFLLDVNMPGLSGFELCTLIKAHARLKHIPVIFISAMSDTREKLRAFECSAVDYITIPFEPRELIARIKIHLNLARIEVLQDEIQTRIRTEQKYYAQLDNLADSIIHINQQGEIVYCNPITEQYFGYSRGELHGQSIEVLIPEHQRTIHAQHRRSYVQSPTTRQMSTVKRIMARRKNGDTFPVDIGLSTLYSEEGILVSAEIRDITEQLRLKMELETQQQFFADAFSKTPDGIMLSDSEERIMLTNPSITSMLGYTDDELNGKHLSILFNNSTEDNKIRNLYMDSPATKEKSTIVNYMHKDGSTIPTEVSIVAVKNKQGKGIGHFTIVRDITERIKMEQENKSLIRQLMQAQKMEALGQLTGGIAHDFNNILASVIGFTELTQELLENDQEGNHTQLNAQLCDYLDEIHTAGIRAKDLIEKMLTFSRSGNNGTLNPSNISILINETIRMLRPILPATIKINTYTHDDLPEVKADPVQVHQMIMNICINARDAMEGKGKIDIFLGESCITDHVCNSCQQQLNDEFLELAIQDNGPGVDSRILDRLFEPFFTTKKAGKGTGMGLAMVHGIIHHHHGHILVDSKPGEGTSFRILFPKIKDYVNEVTDNKMTESELAEQDQDHIPEQV